MFCAILSGDLRDATHFLLGELLRSLLNLAKARLNCFGLYHSRHYFKENFRVKRCNWFQYIRRKLRGHYFLLLPIAFAAAETIASVTIGSFSIPSSFFIRLHSRLASWTLSS